MEFPDIDATLEKCKNHLEITKSTGSEIESFFTSFLLVYIYSRFEMKIKEIISLNLNDNCKGKDLSSFFAPYVDNMSKRLKTSEISTHILRKFGKQYEELFKNKLNDKEQNVTAYNNIITNRHKVAHGEGSNFTFSELSESVRKSKVIFDLLKETIDSQPQFV